MRIRERLTYANVAATLALVLAVAGLGGGVAYAHGKVGPKDIKKDAVKSKDIKDGTVTGADIGNGQVSGADLAPRAQGTAWAGVIFDGTTATVDEHFSRLGAAPTAVRSGVGEYIVRVPGFSSTDKTHLVQVTPQHTSALFCSFAPTTGSEPTCAVLCANAAGAAVDPHGVSVAVFKD